MEIFLALKRATDEALEELADFDGLAGYLSTSSASSTCTGREAREEGLFAPTMAILPPGNTFSSMVFPAPRRSLIIPRNTGVSCMDFASLFLEKLSAIVIVGCIIRIGTGS